MQARRAILALPLLMMISGCSMLQGTKVPLTPNEPMRALTVGDCATYTQEAELSAQGLVQGRETTECRAAVTAATMRHPLSSSMARLGNLTFSQSVTQNGKAVTVTTTDILGQDSNNRLYHLGATESDNQPGSYPSGGVWMDTTPFLYLPAQLKVGDSWTYKANFPDKTWRKYSGQVESTEWVKTPIGSFEAYKVLFAVEMKGNDCYSGYLWINPKIGLIPVKRDVVYTLSAAASIKIHAVDTPTSITLAGGESYPAKK